MNEVNATPHAELIAELMNPNISKNEREHAAVREIERLREALENPVLQDIEQYRLQMAGICVAAIGYYKEGDNIHPDCNTLALRDVAKLYAKYDALYKAQSQRQWVGLDALETVYKIIIDWDECGGKRSRRELARRIVDLYAAPPQRPWVGLTDEEIRNLNNWWPSYNDKRSLIILIRDAEAKLKEKNT
jgi:hypothetical protein